MKRILVCTDGEEHTHNAEEQAITLALKFNSQITALFVQTTFLHKFTNEIYAVGRNECRDHLETMLQAEGNLALNNFARKCSEASADCKIKLRSGDIAEQILAEAHEGGYDLLIMGVKRLRTWREKLESYNVPQTVFKQAQLPMLFVP